MILAIESTVEEPPMRFFLGCILALTLWNAPCSSAQTNTTRTDILIADFEGTRYGSWTATGEAFGPGPARGTFPGQMTVSVSPLIK